MTIASGMTAMALPSSAGIAGVAAGQVNPGGQSGDLLATAQSIGKGGMRGIGLVAAILGEVILKNKAIDIAEKYYDVNKRDFDWFVNQHEPSMAVSAAQAMAGKTYQADLYASLPGAMSRACIIDEQWFETRRRIPKYNIGQMARLDYDMSVAKASALTSGWMFGIQYEYDWALQHRGTVFKRKVEIANIGNDVGNIARDGLGRAATNLASAYDHAGDTLASIGNGYAAKAGYQEGRDYAKGQFDSKADLPKGMQQ